MSLSNKRVEVNKRYVEIYRQLTGQDSLYPAIFKQHGDLFTLCACIGFVRQHQGSSKGADLFWSHSMDQHQQTVLTALAVKHSGDYTVINQTEEIVRIAQQYADGGMEILVGEVLDSFLRKDSGNELSLDYSEASGLEAEILYFVQNELARDPFGS